MALLLHGKTCGESGARVTIERCRLLLHASGSVAASMELSFSTKKLRTVCLEHDNAVDMMGEPAADVLRTRIADLRAATYLADLPPVSRPTIVDGDPPELHFELRDGWSLLMAVIHQTIPRTATGGLDQARVHRARVDKVAP